MPARVPALLPCLLPPPSTPPPSLSCVQIQAAKDEKLSVEAALEYLNGTLLLPPLTPPQLLKDYMIALPISNYTAWFWMRACGALAGKFKQSYYNDNHEAEFVKRDRKERYIPEMDGDELHQPLWAHIPRAEYDKLAECALAECAQAKGTQAEGWRLPPPRHEYKDESGTRMVEMHVDDSNHFEDYRARHPLGGSFSMRWAGRPAQPPSAPPADLPHPAEDTLVSSASAAPAPAPVEDAGAAAEGAAAGAAEGAGAPQAEPPQALTKTEIGKMSKPALKAACIERGLPVGDTRAALQTSLRQHLFAAPQPASNEGEGAGEEAEGEAGRYVVESIINRCASPLPQLTPPLTIVLTCDFPFRL